MLNKIKDLLTSSAQEEIELLRESLDCANAANEKYKETINDLTERITKDGTEIEKLKEELTKYKALLTSEVKAYNDLLKDINGISRQFISKQFHMSPDTLTAVYHNIGKNDDKPAWIPKEPVTVSVLTEDTVNKNHRIYNDNISKEKKIDPNFFHVTDDTEEEKTL